MLGGLLRPGATAPLRHPQADNGQGIRADRANRADLPRGGADTAFSEALRGSPPEGAAPRGAAVPSSSIGVMLPWRSTRAGRKPGERPSSGPASAARSVRSRTAPTSKTSETSPLTQPLRAFAPREPPSSPHRPATPNARMSSVASARSCPAVRRRRRCSPSTFVDRCRARVRLSGRSASRSCARHCLRASVAVATAVRGGPLLAGDGQKIPPSPKIFGVTYEEEG